MCTLLYCNHVIEVGEKESGDREKIVIQLSHTANTKTGDPAPITVSGPESSTLLRPFYG